VLGQTKNGGYVTGGGDTQVLQDMDSGTTTVCYLSESGDKGLKRPRRIVLPCVRKVLRTHVRDFRKLTEGFTPSVYRIRNTCKQTSDSTTRQLRLGTQRGKGRRQTDNLVRTESSEITH